MSKTIGIIGGMGPEATADLYRKIIQLTPASKDQDHIHVIIDGYAQIPDRTAFILNGGEDPTPYLIKSAKLLENAGADALVMPCNTAHYFSKAITDAVNIPLLGIVDATIKDLKKTYPQAKSVLPLSTTGTKAGKIYETKLIAAGYTILELPQDLADNVMTAIYDGVKKGKTSDVLALFQKTLDEIALQVKPDVIISACTEIPILMERSKSEIPVIDATLALAESAVEYALNNAC